MNSTNSAKFVAQRLKGIAQRQLKVIEPKKRKRPIRPSEQLDRYRTGQERWRLDAGLVTPEQYAKYEKAMKQRMMEGR